MQKLLLSLLSLSLLLFYGCGESVYSSAESKTSEEVKQDQLDFDFISGKCADVISTYESLMYSGRKLNDEEIYVYVSSLLNCSGFDIVRGMDSILITGGSDIYMTAGALMGIKTIDMNKSKFLQSQYNKAVYICDNRTQELKAINGQLSSNLKSICGLTGIMGTVINMSSMMLNTSGGGASVLELSEVGFKELSDNIVPEIAGQSLTSYLSQEHTFLESLNNSLTLGEDGANEIGSLMGQSDFGSVIGGLAKKLRDPKTNRITEESLINYIETEFGLKIPNLPVPPLPPIPPIP